MASDYEDVCATDVLLTYLGLGCGSWLSDELQSRSRDSLSIGRADFVTQPGPALISIIVAGDQDQYRQSQGRDIRQDRGDQDERH